ncbi:hypothetical protein ABZ307_40750 [Streptomyces griseorubiginosus]|uniref:hypothetical protein n=1 Tax=Streptomyces griseorubiginosus TaxID=67304 RepID=UPI0033A4345B
MDPADAEYVAGREADLRRVIDADLAPIRTEPGRIPRQVSGYQLHRLLPENGFDMTTYKAEFLHQHYEGRLRPRSHYSPGGLPRTSALAGYAARPLNALLRGPVGTLLAHLGGVTTRRRIPAFASRRTLREVLPAVRTDVPATASPVPSDPKWPAPSAACSRTPESHAPSRTGCAAA